MSPIAEAAAAPSVSQLWEGCFGCTSTRERRFATIEPASAPTPTPALPRAPASRAAHDAARPGRARNAAANRCYSCGSGGHRRGGRRLPRRPAPPRGAIPPIHRTTACAPALRSQKSAPTLYAARQRASSSCGATPLSASRSALARLLRPAPRQSARAPRTVRHDDESSPRSGESTLDHS